MADLCNVLLVFVFVFTNIADGTLLSRFKNQHEYVARDDAYGLDGLDEETYQHVMEDLPQLKYMIKSGKPWYRRQEHDNLSMLDGEEYEDYGEFDDTEEYNNGSFDVVNSSSNASSTSSTRVPYSTHWPEVADKNDSRRWFLDWLFTPYIGPRKARCYWCGMNVRQIPRSPLCHDMFDSDDGRARTLKRYYRGYCYDNRPRFPAHRKKTYYYGGTYYRYDRGLINQYYGRFVGGCFKRFLDVGSVYTQRGCRHWWPLTAWHIYGWFKNGRGKSFAGHRFKMLEAILKRYKEKCIVSPHASLTPFARGISLYVRYHVCVCNSKYCNTAGRVAPSVFSICLLFVAKCSLINMLY